MPFTKVNINKVIEEKRKQDPDFKKVWDDSREEYRLNRRNDIVAKSKKSDTEWIGTNDRKQTTGYISNRKERE